MLGAVFLCLNEPYPPGQAFLKESFGVSTIKTKLHPL